MGAAATVCHGPPSNADRGAARGLREEGEGLIVRLGADKRNDHAPVQDVEVAVRSRPPIREVGVGKPRHLDDRQLATGCVTGSTKPVDVRPKPCLIVCASSGGLAEHRRWLDEACHVVDMPVRIGVVDEPVREPYNGRDSEEVMQLSLDCVARDRGIPVRVEN